MNVIFISGDLKSDNSETLTNAHRIAVQTYVYPLVYFI